MSRPPSWPFDVAKGAVALAFGWGWYTTPNPDAPPEIMMASRWSRVRELAWIIWTGDPAFEKTLLNDSFLFGLLGLCISLALVAVGQFFCFVLLPWLMVVLFGSTEAPGHGEGQLSVFVCRNAVWSAAGHLPVAGPGSHFQYAACGGVFLG